MFQNPWSTFWSGFLKEPKPSITVRRIGRSIYSTPIQNPISMDSHKFQMIHIHHVTRDHDLNMPLDIRIFEHAHSGHVPRYY